MLKKYLFFLGLFFLTPSFATTPSPLGFEAAEHVMMGDQVKLYFDRDDSQGKTGIKLSLPNGLSLTYGEIVSLAGDFYGIPELPIASGKTQIEKKKRFVAAYNTLAMDEKAGIEVSKIMAIVQDEKKQLEEGLQKGEKPADIYARMSLDHNVDWNCITGGLCAEDKPGMTRETLRKIYFLKQGRYLRLADTDFDHFGEFAWEAYAIGHQLALEIAILAGQTHDTALLVKAYTINAFACHYLSDSFSAGHMRNPRDYLYDKVFPATVGSLLSSYMHKEDGQLGLVVINKRGDVWKAYGDAYYFDEHNKQNRKILEEAMQRSANAIFFAYLSKTQPSEDKTHELIPDIEQLTPQSRMNHSPLFYWDTKTQKLLRRNNLNSPSDYQWTPYWLGWETLLELIHSQGLPHAEQGKLLAHADTKAEAIRLGIVTDKEILRALAS